MACLITHEQQEQVQTMVKELIKLSDRNVQFSLEIADYPNEDEKEIYFTLWIGKLQKNYIFPTLKEMFNAYEPLAKQIEAQLIKEKALAKYECRGDCHD